MIRDFPLGPVPLLLIVLCAASGLALVSIERQRSGSDLEMWVFAATHEEEYRARLAGWPASRGVVDLQNLGTALRERLALALLTGQGMPDLFELEHQELTLFFRGPRGAVPFMDLTPVLRRDGLLSKIAPARLARYTRNGRVYGIPHDLHPMVLAYRPDLLAEAGVDPQSIQTWDDLVALAPRLSRGGRVGTPDWRYTIGFSAIHAGDFFSMLWQRGGDVFDAEDRVTIDSELAIDTLERYVKMFHGDPPLAGARLVRYNEDERALADGHFVMMLAPDWQLGFYKTNQTDVLGGKLRVMPLPAWERGGRRTSTMGGTMLGLPRSSTHFEMAWALARYLYFEGDAFVGRYRQTMILPPNLDALKNPVFDEPDPFFGGQVVGRILANLARDVPAVHGVAYASLVRNAFGDSFPEIVAGRVSARDGLRRIAAELRRQIERERFADATAEAAR